MTEDDQTTGTGLDEPPRETSDEAALIEDLYDEVVALAARHHERERPGHTLQPTAIAHEAYLRLERQRNAWSRGRAYFLGAASAVIRRVLVDHARARGSDKRGGGWERVDLQRIDVGFIPPVPLIDLDAALVELAALSWRQARVVELRFFGGLDVGEVAALLGVSPRTVADDWRVAKAWLRTRLAAAFEP